MNTTMDKPTVLCRCCGHAIDPKYQPPLMPGKEGFFYLTCETEGCKLAGQTFTTRTYDTLDLSAYLCKK